MENQMKKIYFLILPLVFLAVLAACTSSSTTPLPTLTEPKSTSTEPMPTSTEPMPTPLPTEPSQPASIVSPDTIADIDQFLEKMNKEQENFQGAEPPSRINRRDFLKVLGRYESSARRAAADAVAHFFAVARVAIRAGHRHAPDRCSCRYHRRALFL